VKRGEGSKPIGVFVGPGKKDSAVLQNQQHQRYEEGKGKRKRHPRSLKMAAKEEPAYPERSGLIAPYKREEGEEVYHVGL